MSFVENIHAKRLDFLSEALSQALLTEHAGAIAAVNAHLNQAMRPEQRTATIVKTLNDRIYKDMVRAYQEHRFPDVELLVEHGMTRMSYVPAEQRDTVELLYRVMLQGALMQYATTHPAYRDTAHAQLPEHERGIAKVYAKLRGGGAEAGIDYALGISSAIEQGAVSPAR